MQLASFIETIGSELGDSRRIARATEYVEALLTESAEPKTFAQLARLIGEDEPDRYRREQSFQHLVNGSGWDPVRLLRPAAEQIASEIDVKALMLVAAVFPHLGEHTPHYTDRRGGGQQIAAVMQIVGVDGRDRSVILPIRWRLSLEGREWLDPELRRRAEVDYAVGVHVSIHGRRQVEEARGWDGLSAAPIVAGPSYGWLRSHWLQASRQGQGPTYVVELPELAGWTSMAELEMLVSTRADDIRIEGPEAIAMAETGLGRDGGRRSEAWSFYELVGELGPERVVVCRPSDERGAGRGPRAWCTNLPIETFEERQRVVDLARLRRSASGYWHELRYGLLSAASYRGLSVKGWERHCALVTAAEAFRIHAGLEEPSRSLAVPAGSPRTESGPAWREEIASRPLNEHGIAVALR